MKARWLVGLLLVVAAAFAQEATELFEQAPPHIDEALRERVRLFFQAHVDGKFRLADEVVHPDSKDAFFAAEKRRYKSFEIVKIQYFDHFSRARVVVAVDGEFPMPGFGQIPVKIPMTTLWKYDQGQWWWYVEPPEKGQETPFGLMRPGPEAGSGGLPGPGQMLTPEAVVQKVHISKRTVQLKCYEASQDVVEVSNGMPGPISLQLYVPPLRGLEVSLDKEGLAAGEKALIRFRYEPPDKLPKPTLKATLRVEPLAAEIPIEVVFDIPPEIKQQLPPALRK